MITKISQWIVNILINQNIITNDEQELYVYCFEILLSLSITIIGVSLIWLCRGEKCSMIVFVSVFFSFRSLVGVYHTYNHWLFITLTWLVLVR